MAGSSSTTSTCGCAACWGAWDWPLMVGSMLMAGESSQRRGMPVTAVILARCECKLHAIGRVWNAKGTTGPSRSATDVLGIGADRNMRDLASGDLAAEDTAGRKR